MIKEITIPILKNPVFIAAWPGMGEVAYRSALFLKEVMGFKLFAKLESGEFFKPAAVFVDKGIISLPSMPAGFFYYLKRKGKQDVILFLGEAQPPLEYAEDFSYAIIDFIKKYKVKKIFTFAAKPEPIDHHGNAAVWIAATDAESLAEFSQFNLKILTEGQVSGLNGIIIGAGKNKKIPGICFLGEIPFYTVQIENPKASYSILKILSEYLDLQLNLTPLEERCKFIENEIEKLIGYLKGEMPQPPPGPSPLSEDDVDKLKNDLAAYNKLPSSIRQKIEELFKDAQKDITIAGKLKDELDHWNVYKDYEDRFLDLFKRKDKKDETH
jgi:hypothetical protein